MCQVMFVINVELVGSRFLQLVRVLCAIRLRNLRALLSRTYTENVRDDVSGSCTSTFSFNSQSNLDVGLALRIRIVLGILAQSLFKHSLVSSKRIHNQSYLEDDEIINLDLAGPHIGTDGGEVLVNVFHDGLCCFSGQNLIQDIPVGPHQVKACAAHC